MKIFFGENNKFYLCVHVSEHGIEAEESEDKMSEVGMKPSKRKRTVIPRIKVNARDVRSSLLTDLIKFYSEDSNASVVSETSSIPLNCGPACDGDDLAGFGSPECNDSSDGVSSTVISLPSDHFQSNTALDLFSNHSFNDSGDEIVSYERNDSNGLLHQVSGVSVENLKASLLAIVSVHNASDALLNHLLKRDQLLFDGQSVSPWAVKKQFEDFCSSYQCDRTLVEKGELILMIFRPLLVDIVKTSLSEMFEYAEKKLTTRDILMPKFAMNDQREVIVRLIVNTDGTAVCKTPTTSAWPLFFAIADLPPKPRQLFKNLVLGALFVGSGYPDIDVFFEHTQNELSVSEKLTFNEEELTITFEPILLVTDLIAKSKALKMKQFNGYYGCTLCTQRGIHLAYTHRYPHDHSFEMRSFDSHMRNIQELENGSVDKLRAELGPKEDCEFKTHGVKGRSKAFDVISNQPLSSPIDPMHQIFLGVAKDLLQHHYNKMDADHKAEINTFLEYVDLPKEFKNKVRSLEALASFKAKEVKFLLFYLSAIIFPP